MARKSKMPRDVNQMAAKLVRMTTGQEPLPRDARNPKAIERGTRGGKARAEKLTAKERTAIAKRAAEARWNEQS